MRSILNVSVPEKMKKEIQKRAKKAGKTVSAYVISVISLEKEFISEDQLIKMAKKAKHDYKKGKTKILKSLKDLMDK